MLNLKLRGLIYGTHETFTEFAEATRIDPVALSRIVRGHRQPTEKQLAAMRKILGADRVQAALEHVEK